MPRASARRLHLHPALLVFTVLLLCSAVLSAQAPVATPTGGDGHPYTLHVYKRVVQVPTLVLDPEQHLFAKPIDTQRFTVSLDNGPRFHPTRIRLEGSDPLSISILLDLGGSQQDLLPALERDLSAWVSASLQPQDRVSIYAVDCTTIRTALHLPPDPQLLTRQLHLALNSQLPHRNRPRPSCGNALPLWNSLIAIMQNELGLSTRSVILAFTIGYNGAGTLNWADVRTAAARSGVSIFAFSQRDFIDISPTQGHDRSIFDQLCQTSGGLTQSISPSELPSGLTNFTNILRNRYILEFPIPFNPTSGTHKIEVDISHLDAFIQPAGVDFDIPDPNLAKDPSTVPSDDSNAPHMGKHRPPY